MGQTLTLTIIKNNNISTFFTIKEYKYKTFIFCKMRIFLKTFNKLS